MIYRQTTWRTWLGVTVMVHFALTGVSGAEGKKPVPVNVRPIDPAAAATVSFARHIKPLLLNYCVECHSATERKGEFETTSVAEMLKSGKRAGPGIVPGKPDDSAIVQYIQGAREPQMPKGNPPLSEDELHLVRQWIAAGAKDDSASSDSTAPAADAHPFYPRLTSAESFAARRAERLATVPPAAPPPKVSGPVFNAIDQFLLAQWQAAGLPEAKTPPPVCDDPTFLRRVYLDIIGVPPTLLEARRFMIDPSPDKRAKLVDELLARRRDYADHWTPFWLEALGSANMNTQGGIVTRGNYLKWVNDSFFDNKPYDLMVAELIDPTLPGHKRAMEQEVNGVKHSVSYIRNQSHTDTIQTAANVAQVFLGTSMKCASCHSHFENREWPQARFLAFAGFFADRDLELIRCEKKTGETVPAKLPFELAGAPLEAPVGVDDRLHRLALWLTDPANPRFARTMANRLWKRYFGLGLAEPVDDLRVDRPASNPALLDWLADDFMRHDFDLKHTIRLILTSRAYQLRYHAALEDYYDSAHPEKPRYFRSPSLRRLTAEQLLDSVAVVTMQRLTPSKRAYSDHESTPLTRALGRPASRNEISTSRSDDPAVVQALELLNGPEYSGMIYGAKLLDVAATAPNPTLAVDGLFLAAFYRVPTQAEGAASVSLLQNSPPSPGGSKPVDIVMVDDALPPVASPDGSNGTNSWRWVAGPDFPVLSGSRAYTFNGTTNAVKQMVVRIQDHPLKMRSPDSFYTHVYLDPKDPPKSIMLQWHQDEVFHQAYWSDEPMRGDVPKATLRYHLGPLPALGRWVRLEVPFNKVALDTGEIDSWSFDQAGGVVYWDKTGVIHQPRHPLTGPLGDLFWALLTSPEFQYLR
ncbi:MAG: PSD1 and planctomycete cytochrome C domain-containing protein [Verrucomicrobiota bacterium]